MGEERVRLPNSREESQDFLKALLRDVRAMEKMLTEDWFEEQTIHIGAEQELCLIDRNGKPMPVALELLRILDDSDFTTELARFNLETNLDPLPFEGSCLSVMEQNILTKLDVARQKIRTIDGQIALAGVLPTVRKSDLNVSNITPLPRYHALCDAINKLRGDTYDLRIQGTDELLMQFDTPLLEACNTGFQVHLQVAPSEFVDKYNIAQAIAGPVLAGAVNSPLLFGKRLWSETRIALFHQSVDTRKVQDHLRESSPRVTFGNQWLKESILEIYREDIARYRVILSANVKEDVEVLMEQGIAPQLMALQVHNGTVYRWNRPCYGINGGKPHLRIENRVFPSGPTVTDEIANAAFWLGLLNGLGSHYADITEHLDFEDARMNFFAASKMGLDTTFTWVKGRRYPAVDLIHKELIPIAREGLERANIHDGDITSYLDVIRDRTSSGRSGSYWMVKSYNGLIKNTSREQALTALTNAMIKNQMKGEPVHRWALARMEDMDAWRPSTLLVEEFMTTDLFTVQKDDILELVAHLIDWRRIRYVPVEDDSKHLVGLISMRMVFREYYETIHGKRKTERSVEEVMIQNPVTIHPEASIMEAIALMDSKKIGCLPVVKNNRLVGIITEQNYMMITSRLLRRLQLEDGDSGGATSDNGAQDDDAQND